MGLHVLIISSNVSDADDLAAAAKDDVLVIRYDAESTDANGLAQRIHYALGGKKADSIAFAVHNDDGVNLHLTDTDITTPDNLTDANQQAFWKSVGNDLSDNGRIDLLTCNVTADQTGIKFVSDLESITGKNVAASSDLTGNAAHGGNWVMESDNIDIQKVYFDDHRIDSFDAVMGPLPATHGNHIIPDISMVIGSYSYYVFPSDTFTDPDDTTITYTAAGLPKGVYFAASYRQIYGTPTTLNSVGNYPVTVWAAGSDGIKDSLTFTLHLGPKVINGGGVPQFNTVTPFSVEELAANGTLLSPSAGVIATDPQGVYPATGGLAQNPYRIVWSSVNLPGDSYGVNRSPFSIDSSGYLSVSGEIDYETVSQYTLLVEAVDTAVGTAPALTNTAQVVISVNLPDAIGGYQLLGGGPLSGFLLSGGFIH